MRRRTVVLMAVLALASASVAACDFDPDSIAAPPAPTATAAPELMLTVNGAQRSYELFVPDGDAPDDGWPLVIVVHGLGGSASQMRALTGFDEVAAGERFIAAYPNGLARAWIDAGIGSAIGGTDIAAQNLAFMDALIDSLDAEYGLDERRLYMTGLSNGGMFAFHSACHMADRFAAVGLVASASISQSFDSCEPAESVGYIAFHGTSDTVVPYDGGQIVPGFEDLGAYQSAAEAAGFWANVNGCLTAPEREQLPDTNSGDISIPYLDSWEPCESGQPVQLITLDGSGHTWPGHPPRGQRLGATNLDIDATAMIWEFFAAHPKPGTP